MRMWRVPTNYLCNQHLLGEHVELHMLVGNLNKGKSVQGFLNDGLIEVHNIKNRHEELKIEMAKRGMNHKSPLPEFKSYIAGNIDIENNILELIKRCPKCKNRILKAKS